MSHYGSGSSPYTGTGSLPSPPGLAPIFYGTGPLGANPAFPDNLTAYQNTDGTAVLYWTLNPVGSGLPSVVWTVETDLVDTFDSSDLLVYESSEALVVSDAVRTQAIDFDNPLVTGNTYSVDVDGSTVAVAFTADSDTTMAAIATAIALELNVATAVVVTGAGVDDDRRILVTPTASAVSVVLTSSIVTGGASQATTSILEVRNLIAGCVHKGLVVPAYTRLQGQFDDMFWRVKGTIAAVSTAFTESLFRIPEAIDQIVKQDMVNLLPDVVYKKDLQDGDTNLAKIYLAVGKERDELNLETIFANNDLFTEFVRDSSLKENFGSLLELEQPGDMKTIDFREILRVLLAISADSPSLGSVRKIIRAMFGVDPTFELIRDTLTTFVDDPSSTPPVLPFHVDDSTTSPTVDPETLWDNQNLSFGVVITINNPLACTWTREFVESVVLKLTPVFAPIYILGI